MFDFIKNYSVNSALHSNRLVWREASPEPAPTAAAEQAPEKVGEAKIRANVEAAYRQYEHEFSSPDALKAILSQYIIRNHQNVMMYPEAYQKVSPPKRPGKFDEKTFNTWKFDEDSFNTLAQTLQFHNPDHPLKIEAMRIRSANDTRSRLDLLSEMTHFLHERLYGSSLDRIDDSNLGRDIEHIVDVTFSDPKYPNSIPYPVRFVLNVKGEVIAIYTDVNQRFIENLGK